MNFMSVREMRQAGAALWADLPDRREIVITNNGRPVAILAATTDTGLESRLDALRRSRCADAISALQGTSMRHGLENMTADEIDDEIAQARKARRHATRH